MTRRKKPTASRGFVNNIILECLLSGDKYGYEIIKIVEEKSDGKIILKQPSLYSSLKRFEDKGYITSYWGDSDIGGRRHYYTITEPGKNYFNNINSTKTNIVKKDIPQNNSINYVQESLNIKSNISTNNEPQPLNNDEEYDVFSILEKENKSVNQQPSPSDNSIQINMFNTSPQNDNKINDEQHLEIETINKLNNEHLTKIIEEKNDNSIYTKKDIPLINENNFNINTDITNNDNSKDNEQINKNLNENEISKKEEEKPATQISIDEFGIIKIGEPKEESPNKHKIYDNVVDRIECKDPVIATSKPKNKTKDIDEISEEERELKNKNFTNKFEKIIYEEQKNKQQNIDYKNILGDLLANEEDIHSNNDTINSSTLSPTSSTMEEITDEQIESAISNIQTNNENIQSLNQINDGFKFKPYMEEDNTKEIKNNNFILINKAKLHFGLFTFIILLCQISALYFILKSNNLIFKNDYIYYIVAYTLSGLFALTYITPYLFTKEKRQFYNYKLKFSLLYGILIFLGISALTYALCTFYGLTMLNANMFATKLLLPIILSFNFILFPIIYKIITLNKKLF